MIIINFYCPQVVVQDGLQALAMFIVCKSYLTLTSGDIISSDDENNFFCYKRSVHSIESVKPTDL